MTSVIDEVNASFLKKAVVNVRSGDTVRVHQKVKEGSKERVQVFQGLVIRTGKSGGHLSRITVRRIASGIGVEKSFLVHSPLVVKVEVTKRSKVRRNYLSYMRVRTGKSARLASVGFDRTINDIPEDEPEAPEVSAEPTEVKDEPESKPEKEQALESKEEPKAEETKEPAAAGR